MSRMSSIGATKKSQSSGILKSHLQRSRTAVAPRREAKEPSGCPADADLGYGTSKPKMRG